MRTLVVGATDGIGRALAEVYASRGFWVTLVGRNEEKLGALVADLRSRFPVATVNAVVADMLDDARVEPAWKEALEKSGHLDVFVYNAGDMRPGDGLTSVWDDDRTVLQVNVNAAVHWCGLAANYFRLAGKGKLVGISSIAGDRGRKGNPVYGTTKAAMNTYLEALRNRLAESGVHVCTIKPGFVDTVMTQGKKTFWLISAEEAARLSLAAARSRANVRYVPRRWWFVGTAIRAIPSFLFRHLNV